METDLTKPEILWRLVVGNVLLQLWEKDILVNPVKWRGNWFVENIFAMRHPAVENDDLKR